MKGATVWLVGVGGAGSAIAAALAEARVGQLFLRDADAQRVKAMIVCDIIMKPRETQLLEAAQARGMRVQHGQHMMDAQVPMYLEFLGIPFPDEQTVLELCSRA